MLNYDGGDVGCSLFGNLLLDLCSLGGPLLGLEGQRRVPRFLVFPVQQDGYPCILDRRMCAVLDLDAENLLCQFFERGGLALGQSSEGLVSGSVAEQSLRVVQQQSFEIVMDGVSNHNLVLDNIGHLLLCVLKLGCADEVFWGDATDSCTEVGDEFDRADVKIEDGDAVKVDNTDTGQC